MAARTRIKDLINCVLPRVMWWWVYHHVSYNIFAHCVHHTFWCQIQKVNKTLLIPQVSGFCQTFTEYILQIRSDIFFQSITSGFQC